MSVSKTRALFSWLLVSSLALPVAAQEGEPTAGEKADKTEAATQKAEVETLIQQLGDSSYRVRRDAEEGLREIGEPALKALEQAAEKNADPEVQWRARRLARQIAGGEERGLRARQPGDRPAPRGLGDPGAPPDLGRVFDNLFERLERDFEVDVPRHRFFQDDFFRDLDEQMKDMQRRLQTVDPRGFGNFGAGTGQSFEMSIGPDGVRVKVVEKDENGESETKTYEAPDMKTFREKYPEVAERYMDRDARGLGLRFGRDLRPFGSGIPRVQPGFPDLQGLRPFGLDDGPRLGVYVSELDADALEELGVEAERGLQVREVVPGSLAEDLGVEADDIVLEIGGRPVGSVEDVREALREAGDAVKVKVQRGGKTRVLEAKNGGEAAEKGEELKPRKLRRRAR